MKRACYKYGKRRCIIRQLTDASSMNGCLEFPELCTSIQKIYSYLIKIYTNEF